MALTADGDVLTWGDDAAGQLGNGRSGGDQPTPAPIDLTSVGGTDDDGRIVAIAYGFQFGLLLTDDGNVLSFGDNGQGELGDGSSAPSSDVPVAVSLGAAAGTITKIAAGGAFDGDHAVALTSSGTVLTWGFGADGELGDGTAGHNRSTPTTVLGVSGTGPQTGVVAVGAGYASDYAALS